MFESDALRCFQFNNYTAFHEQISKIFPNDFTRKMYEYLCLLFDFESHLTQGDGKRVLVNFLKESVTQFWINHFEEGVENLICDITMFERNARTV